MSEKQVFFARSVCLYFIPASLETRSQYV